LEYQDRSIGANVAEWDGKNSNGTLLQPGLYRYVISAKDSEGKAVDAEGRAALTVSGVRMEEGKAKLLVGDLAIDPSTIVELR
jgi:flagellar basal-body rod modification protein FlgD